MKHLFLLIPALVLTGACKKEPAQSVALGATVRTETRAAQDAPVGLQTSIAVVAPQSVEPVAKPVSQTLTTVGSAQGASPAAVKPVPAELPSTVASVNGEAIDRSEFERAIRTVETGAGGPVPQDRRSEILRNVLDELIGYHLLLQESKTRKVAVSEAEIDARIDDMRKQFPDDDTYKKVLAEQSLTLELLRRETRNDILASKIVEAEVSTMAPVQEKEIRDYYMQNPEQFKEGETVRASHIMLGVEENANAAAKSAARAKAEDLLKQARGGASFAALARQYSQDPGSAANGGDLGFIARGQLVPAFEAVVFALKSGEIGGVVESPSGFHVVKAIERRAPRTVPLAEAGDQIGLYLTEIRRQQRTKELIDRLKAKSKIEVFF